MQSASRQQRRSVIIITVVIAALAILLQCLPDTWQASLRYDRHHPEQVWRFMTGQLLHLGWVHLWLNLAGLGLITALFLPEWSAKSFLFAFFISALVMCLGIHLFSPELIWYVGLSGILHGLLGAGALYSYPNQPRFAMLLLVGVAAKIGWEQISGSSIGTEQLIGGKVAYDAHLFGFIGGIIGALIFSLLAKKNAHA